MILLQTKTIVLASETQALTSLLIELLKSYDNLYKSKYSIIQKPLYNWFLWCHYDESVFPQRKIINGFQNSENLNGPGHNRF